MIISRSAAEAITYTALREAHLKERQEEELRENDLAVECWASVFPQDVRDAALAMPKGWLRLDTCLLFNADGWTILLNHQKGLPVPYHAGCDKIGALTGELSDRARAFVVERDRKKDERGKAYRDLMAAILAARTYKQLAVAWPEGLPYFENYLPKKKGQPSTALAIPFAKINEALGLSVKGGDDDAR